MVTVIVFSSEYVSYCVPDFDLLFTNLHLSSLATIYVHTTPTHAVKIHIHVYYAFGSARKVHVKELIFNIQANLYLSFCFLLFFLGERNFRLSKWLFVTVNTMSHIHQITSDLWFKVGLTLQLLLNLLQNILENYR